jgi:hypothetical protein
VSAAGGEGLEHNAFQPLPQSQHCCPAARRRQVL